MSDGATHSLYSPEDAGGGSGGTADVHSVVGRIVVVAAAQEDVPKHNLQYLLCIQFQLSL